MGGRNVLFWAPGPSCPLCCEEVLGSGGGGTLPRQVSKNNFRDKGGGQKNTGQKFLGTFEGAIFQSPYYCFFRGRAGARQGDFFSSKTEKKKNPGPETLAPADGVLTGHRQNTARGKKIRKSCFSVGNEGSGFYRVKRGRRGATDLLIRGVVAKAAFQEKKNLGPSHKWGFE